MAKRKDKQKTLEERAQHDWAVSMRKMGDRLLAKAFADEYQRGRYAGLEEADVCVRDRIAVAIDEVLRRATERPRFSATAKSALELAIKEYWRHYDAEEEV